VFVIRHLYRSLIEVLNTNPRMKQGHGYAQLNYDRDEHMFDRYLGKVGLMMCRLDLTFVRAGKDAPSPLTAGRAQDRIGTMYCDYTPYLKAGHYVRCLDGPVRGTFEIRQIPDEAQDYIGVHHIECSVIEVAQALNNIYPNQEPEPYVERID
jgi:hypothetical protein